MPQSKMKYFVIIATLVSLSLAQNVVDIDKLNVQVSQEFVENFTNDIIHADERAGGITAVINDYADKIIANIQNAIIQNGLDPVELPDLTVDLIPAGQVTMTAGWLQETSTIKRNGDVTSSYSTSTKKLEIVLPLAFDALMFQYKYKVKVLLLSVSGGVEGKVSNLRLNMKLDFDFNTYQAHMAKFDITNSGLFTIKFTGNGLVDWLTNAMTTVVSVVLHPLIVRIIQAFITAPVNSVVDAINNIINSILHPVTESLVNAVF